MMIFKKILDWIRYKPEDPLKFAKTQRDNFKEKFGGEFSWKKFAEYNKFPCDVNGRIINIDDHVKITYQGFETKYGKILMFDINRYSVLTVIHLEEENDIRFTINSDNLEIISFEEYETYQILNR